ncbi:MAG: translocation/assembly module TamB domain-containing protein [Gammaproteobacteria bacterium]
MRRQGLFRLFGVLLGLAAIILLLVTVLLASPAGSRWLIDRAAAFAPGTLVIRQITGTLLTGLVADGIDYRLDDTRLQAGRLELAIDPAGLLRGGLSVRRLAIEDAVYQTPATDTGSTAFTPPERIPLPFAFDVKALSIRRLSLQLGTQETVIDELDLSAHAGPVAGLRITRLHLAMAGASAELGARAALHTPYPFSATLDWRGRLPDGMDGAGHATLEGDVYGLRLDHRLNAPFVIDTRGEVRLDAGAPAVALEGEWDGLRWPLQAAAEYRSAHGRYTLNGVPGNYRYTLAGDFEGAEIPPLEVEAKGSGTTDGLAFDELTVAGLDGRLDANGTLDWKAGLAIDLGVEGGGVNPGLLWPDWPGKLGIRTRLLAEVRDEDYNVRLRDARLDGTLHERPVSALGDVTFRAGGVESEQLVIRSGDNGLTLSGRLAERLDIEFNVDAQKLEQLVPDLAGSITGTGSLHGEPSQPGGRIEWSGSGLRYQDDVIGALKGRVVLDGQQPQRSTAYLEATHLHLGGVVASRLRLDAQGWIEQHRLQLTAVADAGSTLATLQGGYAGGRWSGSLTRADLDLRALGDWRLREPVPLELGENRLKPVTACWAAEPSSVCLDGSWQATGGWRAKARLAALPLKRLSGLFDVPGRIDGELDVEADASGSKGKTVANLQARSAQGTLRIDAEGESPYISRYRNAEVIARYGEEKAGADFRVDLAEGHARGKIEAKLRGNTVDDYPLNGELELAVPDISFINALLTEVSTTVGSAAAKLQLQGSVGAPRLSGYAEILQGRMLVPDLGLELTDIGLRAQGKGTELLTLSGSARSDKGTVNLSGGVRLDPGAHWPFHLDIEGKQFGVARLPEASVTANPALNLSGDSRRVEVKGSVGIPTARIEAKQLPESAVRVSGDQVIVVESESEPQSAPGADKTALVVDVRVKLGDAVYFQGLGLATQLTGNLRLRSLADGDIVGEGVLKLKKGTYEGYGQKLVIQQGRLLFTGPLDNPALDIRATRTAGNVVAGIQITGTLQSPLATVYSDPVMTEAEAMSYLLTGRPLSSTSSTESQAITAAVGYGASNPLTKDITEAIGVDLGVESGATEEESMVSVGKQLSEQLRVEYLYGLFNEAWKMKFTYELSRFFSLTGESGLEQAIDLNLTVDR